MNRLKKASWERITHKRRDGKQVLFDTIHRLRDAGYKGFIKLEKVRNMTRQHAVALNGYYTNLLYKQIGANVPLRGRFLPVKPFKITRKTKD